MRSISSDFKNEQDSGNRNYLKYADVTLIDGTVFNFTNTKYSTTKSIAMVRMPL